jgi:DNA-binding NtrC family response regulator
MTAEQIAGSTTETQRILVVDDEASIRTLLTALFTEAGYEVHTAANATDAMALLRIEVFRRSALRREDAGDEWT